MSFCFLVSCLSLFAPLCTLSIHADNLNSVIPASIYPLLHPLPGVSFSALWRAIGSPIFIILFPFNERLIFCGGRSMLTACETVVCMERYWCLIHHLVPLSLLSLSVFIRPRTSSGAILHPSSHLCCYQQGKL